MGARGETEARVEAVAIGTTANFSIVILVANACEQSHLRPSQTESSQGEKKPRALVVDGAIQHADAQRAAELRRAAT